MIKGYTQETHKVLLEFYTLYGLKPTIEVAYEMLGSNKYKKEMDFRTQVHGEICESVLECCILEFMKERNLNWRIAKGLILKDPENPKSDFLTEVDLTLFTPYKILTFECKSYSGNKKIIEECTIHRPGHKDTDVFSQHSIHIEVLHKIFKAARYQSKELAGIRPMQASLFNFSLGDLKDTRTEEYKKIISVTDCNNINSVLTKYLNKPVCYDMNCVNQILDVLEKYKKSYTSKHLKYVKSLHGGNDRNDNR